MKRVSSWKSKALTRLSNAWAALCGKPLVTTHAMREELVSVRSELAAIKLDLNDARELMATYRARMEEIESDAARSMEDPMEGLFANLTPALSQLRMQAALMESGREISGNSVMALARQLVEVLENAGLEPIGSFGREIPFDPQRHEPLSADLSFQEGEPVVVRFVGYTFRGRMMRKALVERLN